MKCKRLMASGVALVGAYMLTMAYANPLCILEEPGSSLWWILGCIFG